MFTNGWAETVIPENYEFIPLNTAGRTEHKVGRAQETNTTT